MGQACSGATKRSRTTGGDMGGVRRVSIQPTPNAAPTEGPAVESPRLDLPPLTIVPMTPPIEATLRILLNSVPYLIGAAVVRQPAVGDSVEAQVGRMPWLHDRRLLNLQLPDDTLPANRAILLDWPVPYQAEWVGIPPRLLISRLVARERTVGVLLGTLITREVVTAQAREALDLSCELIAAAVGSDSLATFAATAQPDQPRRLVIVPNEPEPEPEPQPMPVLAEAEPILDPKDEQEERDRQVVEEVARALDELTDARSIGRVLRDAVTAIAGVDGFSVSLFNSVRREVAYRYKVVGADPDSAEMGRQAVDGGPDCYAGRHDRRDPQRPPRQVRRDRPSDDLHGGRRPGRRCPSWRAHQHVGRCTRIRLRARHFGGEVHDRARRPVQRDRARMPRGAHRDIADARRARPPAARCGRRGDARAPRAGRAVNDHPGLGVRGRSRRAGGRAEG